MSLPTDPWRNPVLAPKRRRVRASWKSGRRRVFIALLVTAGLYGVYSLIGGANGVLRILALDRQEVWLKSEIATTKTELNEVDRKIANIDHTIEEVARDRYGYVGPNEEVWEIQGADSSAVHLVGPKEDDE